MGILTNDVASKKFMRAQGDSLSLFEQQNHFRTGIAPHPISVCSGRHHLARLCQLPQEIVGRAQGIVFGVWST
jgi:hypothetical protein